MHPNIFLIGRALYLAVSEVIKMRAVPRRREAALKPALYYCTLVSDICSCINLSSEPNTHTYTQASKQAIVFYAEILSCCCECYRGDYIL